MDERKQLKTFAAPVYNIIESLRFKDGDRNCILQLSWLLNTKGARWYVSTRPPADRRLQ